MFNLAQRGFTLLELLVVTTLMGLVAAAGLAIVNTISEQESTDIPNDLTKSKWAQIRYAIIGDSSLILNNSPMLSGYVADMGRLPANINELIDLGDQPVWTRIQLSDETPGLTGEVWGGWRGPYLTGTPEESRRTFRDGWRTPDNPAKPNDFGWVVNLSSGTLPCTVPDCTDIKVQSLGADGLPDGNGFNADYPAGGLNLVGANEWQQTALITFDIRFNKAPCSPSPCTSPALELRIYNFEDDFIKDDPGPPINAPIDSVVMRSSNPKSIIESDPLVTFNHDGTTNAISVTITDTFPMGRYAAVVWCSAEQKVYNGNCSGSPEKQPYYFTMLNTTSPITIPWNIP